jgi:hypothetical protein
MKEKETSEKIEHLLWKEHVLSDV